jgi:hypothetical protein
MRRLNSASDIIDALDGPNAFAQWWGVSPACVSMWRTRGFPAKTYLAMSARLREDHQIDAPPEVWNQVTASSTAEQYLSNASTTSRMRS